MYVRAASCTNIKPIFCAHLRFLSVYSTDFFMDKVKKKRRFRFPLWAKTLIVLFLSVSLVGVISIIYSSNYLKQTTFKNYSEKSTELADTLGVVVNVEDLIKVRDKTQSIYNGLSDDDFVSNEYWGEDNWLTYLHRFDEVVAMPEYDRLMDQISTLHSTTSALYTYVSFVDWDRQRLVYLVDDSELGEDDPENPDAKYIDGDRCLPGMFDEFTEQDKGVVNHKLDGFLPEITNMEQYGWLVSTGRPIFAPGAEKTEDNIQAYAMVEFSMNTIIAEQSKSIATLSWIIVILSVTTIVGGYLLVLFFLLRPVRKLTKAANEYTEGSTNESEGLDKFAKVKIRTKDEIEDLSNSMKKMEGDINKYIADLLSTHTKLEGAEKKADELKTLAKFDALTGVYNKRAYFEAEERLNGDIKEGKASFAISMIDLNDLKTTNDNLGHEKGDELIKGLSNIIKETFKASNLYRIGGDEFAVISENGDLKAIEELHNYFVDAINKSMKEKNIDGMGVSAAIGVAIFDPTSDNNVEDTFKRADRKMYENKKKMKGRI